MSKTIYTNEFGVEISNDQVDTLGGNYSKVLVDSSTNNWTLETRYQNGELKCVINYVYSTSELNTVVTANPNAILIYIYSSNGYTIREMRTYTSSAITNKSQTVWDGPDKCICDESYTMPANLPKYNETEKMYYDNNGELLYQFTYDATGNCIYIENIRDYQNDILPADVGVDPLVAFSWMDYSYYHFAYPSVPTGPV